MAHSSPSTSRSVGEEKSAALSGLELELAMVLRWKIEGEASSQNELLTMPTGDILMLSQGRRDLDNVFTLKDGGWFSGPSVETRHR